MSHATRCPSIHRWQQLLDGAVPEPEQQELTAHLEGCADCRRTLESLAGGTDSLLGLAREVGGETVTRDAGLDEVLARAQAAANAEETQAGPDRRAADEAPYLAPSENPQHLGRLDHYEVLELVGKGGFGTVFKAFDTKLHRVVAIKVLAPELSSGMARQRFIREARAAAAVTHEHVVAIHAIEEDHRPPYIVMQYVAGQSLQDKLDEKGNFEIREILRIGMQIADGLAAAHKQGLVHRDIKPGNILLENGVERVKITDFGLARAGDDASVTQSGVIAGTPMYMSPEQAGGEGIDYRSDLFSLGTVLYVMATGRPPFRASTTMAVLKRVCEDTPRPVTEVNPEVPAWLADIVGKLHAKKPEDRFQSAAEVAELLRAHLAHLQEPRRVPRPADVRPAGPGSEPAAPARPRHRRKVRLLTVVLVLCFVTCGFVPLSLIVAWLSYHAQVRPAPAPRMPDVDGGANLQPAGADGWVPLFDGQTLQGWHAFGNPQAKNGAIELLGDASVDTVRTLPAEFELRMEVKLTTGAGVIRVGPGPRQPNAFPPYPKDGWSAVLQNVGDRFHADVSAQSPHRTEGPGTKLSHTSDALNDTWFKVEIVAKDQKLRLRINDGDPSANFADLKPGVLSLWNNGGGNAKVAVRNIEVKELPPEEPGWVQLFNGKDLTGWKTHFKQPGNWSVESGELVSRNSAGYLFTEKADYADFHLRAEVLVEANGNSGIFFRSPYDLLPRGPGALAPAGYEAELSWWVPVKPGRIMRLAEAEQTLAKPGEWLTMEVIAQGPHLITRINGRTAVEVIHRGGDAVERIVGHAPLDPVHSTRFRSGHIALQAYTAATTVRFRKLEIKELPPSDPAAGDWVPLFNGKDLTGWKKHPDQPTRWEVEDGYLTGRNYPDNTHIFSEKGDYENFHLRLEARVNQEGNSGVYFRTPYSFPLNARFPGGYEAQILHNHPNQDAPLTGSLYGLENYTETFLADNEWFTMEVIAVDNHITIKVNDKVTADYVDEQRSAMKGHLALQAMGPGRTKVQFRKVEIKELPAADDGAAVPPFAVAPFDAARAKEHQEAWARHLGVPVHEQGPLGLTLVLIPPGDGFMGSTQAEVEQLTKEIQAEGWPQVWSDHLKMETPRRRVRLTRPFRLSAHEVTVGQFRAFIEETGYKTDAEKGGQGGKVSSPLGGELVDDPAANWRRPGKLAADESHPVRQVSWNDAAAFCRWLSEKTGRTCRLPTEAEWEFACRAGATGRYSFGDDAFRQKEFAAVHQAAPERVGSLKPNAFGLHDTEGNVWEWCGDWLGAWYEPGPVIDPPGLDKGYARVIRGGGYNGPGIAARCAARWGYVPEWRDEGIGFRVAFDVPAAAADAGWTPLFNGKDLRGCVTENSNASVWRVEDNVLTVELPATAKNAAFLRLDRLEPGDFHLRTEVRVDKGSAHVNFRTTPVAGPWSGYRWSFSGPLYSSVLKRYIISPAAENDPLTPGEWHQVDMTARGPRFIIKVNDKVVADVVDPEAGKHLARGWLRFQFSPGTKVAIRKIEIKELPPTPAAPQEGWVQLFNGEDLTGWQSGNPEFWSAKDGAIEAGVLAGAQPAWLHYMPSLFGNFHLRADVKIEKGYALIHFRTKPDVAHQGYRWHPEGSLHSAVTGDYLAKGNGDFPHGRWVRVEIIADGSRIVFMQDGQVVLDYTDPEPGRHLAEGRLRLQVNPGSKVLFRKIEVKELPAAEVKAPPPQQGDDPLQPLRRLAELAEREVERVETLYKQGVASAGERTEAEIKLIEARVRVAQAGTKSGDVVRLLAELVGKRREQLDQAAKLFERGVVPQATVDEAERSVAEARARWLAAGGREP